MHACVCVWGACIHVTKENSSVPQVPFSHPPPFFKNSLSFPQKLSWAGWPASPRDPPAFITKHTPSPWISFLLFLRTKHGSCCLCGQHFPDQACPQTLALKVWLPWEIRCRCEPSQAHTLILTVLSSQGCSSKEPWVSLWTYIQRPEPWEVMEWSCCNNSYCWGEGKWFML